MGRRQRPQRPGGVVPMPCLPGLPLLGVCVLVLVAAGPPPGCGAAQEEASPRPCCLPPVWEGRTSSMTGQVVAGRVVSFMSEGSIHVDTKNNRFASYQLVETNGRHVNVTVLELVSEKVMYIIVPAARSCMKQPAAPINNCIPANSHHLGTQRLGGHTPQHLEVDAWGVQVTGAMDVVAKALVTRDRCVPVFQSTIGQVGSAKALRAEDFYDVHERIRDTSVFDVPAYCRDSPLVVMDNNVLSLISHHRTRRAVLV